MPYLALMRKATNPSLDKAICDTCTRKIKAQFFDPINTLIDWKPIKVLIRRHDTKGKSDSGKSAYRGLLLFKICLSQTGYGLSDYEVEERVNDSLSCSYFWGMTLEQATPDHGTIS